MTEKISIRFFDDREVRAVWDEGNAKWWFSVLDVIAVLNNQDDYEKNRNYWKYLKAKLKKEGNEMGSVTTQLKLLTPLLSSSRFPAFSASKCLQNSSIIQNNSVPL